MLRDFLYALRALRKTPGFAAIVVVSIALGIAANTTVFSMVNAAMLGALPVRDAGGLYVLSSGRTFPLADYRDFRDQPQTGFQGMAAHFPLAPASVVVNQGTPERVWGQLVSGNYFQLVGPPLALGRGITHEEDRVAGRDAVVVLGDSLWRRRFGADPQAVGKSVFLNGRRYTIVGVMSPKFRGVDRGLVGEFWAPLANIADFMPDLAKKPESRTTYWLVITGRLKAGVSPAQAAAALNVVDIRIHDQFRKQEERQPVTVGEAGGVPGEIGITGFMIMLMVVVGLVLLLACANVANLLLGRAMERRKEIGIRLALGAGRWRLIRQLLAESVTLAVAGAAGGFALAFAAARALSNFQLPLPFPFTLDFTPDLRVLAFTAATAVAAGVIAGLAPALMATRTDLVSAIKDAGAGFGIFKRFGMRNLLVGLQVTLSAILLIGAGLFARSLGKAASMDLGLRAENVLAMTVDPVTAGYSNEKLREFLRQLETRVTALPGVRSVAATNILPLSFAHNSDGFHEVAGPAGHSAQADTFAVTAGYFDTAGIPLVRGRGFNPQADLEKPAVVISKIMARKMFGDEDPIGRRIAGGPIKDSYEIVGISGDSKSASLGEEVKACVYYYLPGKPAEQVMSLIGMTVLVRTSGDPAAMAPAVQAEINKLDPNLAVFGVETMEQHVTKAFLIPRLCATLFGVFGLIGLALASAGLYGVVAYSVRARTKEIGIRMALGARPEAVLALVSKLSLGMVAGGLAIGLGIAWALSRFTASLLYGVSATDAVTFAGVPLALLATAIVAVIVPARRAAAIEPMKALRME
jgi:predicted permease